MKRYIRPAARKAGIHKNIGWHTFRHTFGRLLKDNGEDEKTVQELLRHANSRITLDVYTQAVNSTIRSAEQGCQDDVARSGHKGSWREHRILCPEPSALLTSAPIDGHLAVRIARIRQSGRSMSDCPAQWLSPPATKNHRTRQSCHGEN